MSNKHQDLLERMEDALSYIEKFEQGMAEQATETYADLREEADVHLRTLKQSRDAIAADIAELRDSSEASANKLAEKVLLQFQEARAAIDSLRSRWHNITPGRSETSEADRGRRNAA